MFGMYFVSDEEDPAGLITRLPARFPGGSHVAISHATPDEVPQVPDVERVFDETTEHAHVRTRAAILAAGIGPGRGGARVDLARWGSRIPATRCRPTRPSRTTASWWRASRACQGLVSTAI
jgi:hypothetical protein